MAAVALTPADLAPFASIPVAKAQAMIDGVVARAAQVAPCITDATLSATNSAAARDILIEAILRRNDAGSGAIASQTAGPFGQTLDTRNPRKVTFWPSEIEELEAICANHRGATGGGAFSIDTTPVTPVV